MAEGLINIIQLNYEIIFQLLATVILLLILRKYTYKAYKSYIAKRQKYVSNSIETAKKNTLEAEKLQEKRKYELNALRNKSKNIIEDHQKQGKEIEEKIVYEAKNEAALILKKARDEIKEEEQEVQKRLTGELLNMTIEVVEKVLKEKITEEQDVQFIKQTVDKVNNV